MIKSFFRYFPICLLIASFTAPGIYSNISINSQIKSVCLMSIILKRKHSVAEEWLEIINNQCSDHWICWPAASGLINNQIFVTIVWVSRSKVIELRAYKHMKKQPAEGGKESSPDDQFNETENWMFTNLRPRDATSSILKEKHSLLDWLNNPTFDLFLLTIFLHTDSSEKTRPHYLLKGLLFSFQ